MPRPIYEEPEIEISPGADASGELPLQHLKTVNTDNEPGAFTSSDLFQEFRAVGKHLRRRRENRLAKRGAPNEILRIDSCLFHSRQTERGATTLLTTYATSAVVWSRCEGRSGQRTSLPLSPPASRRRCASMTSSNEIRSATRGWIERAAKSPKIRSKSSRK
jgi:hypothetical protein